MVDRFAVGQRGLSYLSSALIILFLLSSVESLAADERNDQEQGLGISFELISPGVAFSIVEITTDDGNTLKASSVQVTVNVLRFGINAIEWLQVAAGASLKWYNTNIEITETDEIRELEATYLGFAPSLAIRFLPVTRGGSVEYDFYIGAMAEFNVVPLSSSEAIDMMVVRPLGIVGMKYYPSEDGDYNFGFMLYCGPGDFSGNFGGVEIPDQFFMGIELQFASF